MAIERGVDDVDIQELEIEDNSKEIQVDVEDDSFEEILDNENFQSLMETFFHQKKILLEYKNLFQY